MLRKPEPKDKPLRISASTHKLLIQARGCLEKKDGRRRSLDDTVHELAQKEIKENERNRLSF
jgi:hypothetical protein